jgi:hypothetical protein
MTFLKRVLRNRAVKLLVKILGRILSLVGIVPTLTVVAIYEVLHCSVIYLLHGFDALEKESQEQNL